MQNSELPIPRKDTFPRQSEESLEERASIKKRVDELIKSGEGRRASPAVLRLLLGDTHTFHLDPEPLKKWVDTTYPSLREADITDGTVSVSLDYPFRSRIWKTLMQGSSDAHLLNQPSRQVHITVQLRRGDPIVVLYNLYLGGNDYPYHTQSFVGVNPIDNTERPSQARLKATDELLKHAKPFSDATK